MNPLLKSIALFVAASALTLAGCKKGSNDTSLFVLDIYNRMGTDSLVLGKTYQNPLGRNISFSRISYYLCNVQLTNSSSAQQPAPGVVLVTALTGQNIIGSVPVGSYKSLSFDVGLDTANHSDPGTYVNGPYAAQTPSMHFSSDSIGYIFMAVEGLVDTSAAGTGIPSAPFSYHIGTDSLLRAVILKDHSAAPYNALFNATGNHLFTINIIANLATFLGNLDMRANPTTNTTDYPVIADTLANHIPAMFNYQQ